jgi:hypothetical protein
MFVKHNEHLLALRLCMDSQAVGHIYGGDTRFEREGGWRIVRLAGGTADKMGWMREGDKAGWWDIDAFYDLWADTPGCKRSDPPSDRSFCVDVEPS